MHAENILTNASNIKYAVTGTQTLLCGCKGREGEGTVAGSL